MRHSYSQENRANQEYVGSLIDFIVAACRASLLKRGQALQIVGASHNF